MLALAALVVMNTVGLIGRQTLLSREDTGRVCRTGATPDVATCAAPQLGLTTNAPQVYIILPHERAY